MYWAGFWAILGWEQPAVHRMNMSMRVLYPPQILPSSGNHVFTYHEPIWTASQSNHSNCLVSSVTATQTNWVIYISKIKTRRKTWEMPIMLLARYFWIFPFGVMFSVYTLLPFLWVRQNKENDSGLWPVSRNDLYHSLAIAELTSSPPQPEWVVRTSCEIYGTTRGEPLGK